MTSNEYLILASKLRLRFAPGQAKKDHRGPQTDQHVHASVSWEWKMVANVEICVR